MIGSHHVIRFVARDQRELLAYDPLTVNSTYVLCELAWAWPTGQKLCDMKHCPADQGGYCLECHMVAAEARDLVRSRDALDEHDVVVRS